MPSRLIINGLAFGVAVVALVGALNSPPLIEASERRAASATVEWTVPFSTEAGCSGSATVRGDEKWLLFQGVLIRPEATTVNAYCSPRERYLESTPELEWEINSLVELIWPDGQCTDSEVFVAEGREGLLCDYRIEDREFALAMLIIDDYFVAVQAEMMQASSDDRAEVFSLLRSARFTID